MINYLVLSGGGQTFFSYIGIFEVLFDKQYININDIKSIYSTSCGSIIAVFLCLQYKWSDIVDYVIRCPWNDKLKIGIDEAFNILENNGIYSDNLFMIIFKSLLCGKGLTLDITLKEFYEYSQINLHIYTFEFNEFIEVDLSHTTHPDLKLLDAIHMSCSIPLLITPICRDGKCYIDGGIQNNYPIDKCLTIEECDESTVLGIKNKTCGVNNITENSNINDYIKLFMNKIVKLVTNKPIFDISNELEIVTPGISIDILFDALFDINIRKQMVSDGRIMGDNYINT